MSSVLSVVPKTIDPAIVERVLLHGDLSKLTPAQKVSYYGAVCDSVGLNPLTQPFQYLVLNGREVLYALRAATDQLRAIHEVSVQITARELVDDCYVVSARATLPNGRTDDDSGAVAVAGLKGESRANAMMKAATKAKRRVTLSICGLGMLDETEVTDLPGAIVTTAAEVPLPPLPRTVVDAETGEEVAAEEAPMPPPGFYYVSGYEFNDPWHEASLVGWAADGSSLRVSTKLPAVGKLLAKADARGLPIKGGDAEITIKANRKGEGYLNKVTFFDAAQPEVR
jgi:hypothetical protein